MASHCDDGFEACLPLELLDSPCTRHADCSTRVCASLPPCPPTRPQVRLMLVLAPAACCLAGLALSEVVSYLATSLAVAQQEEAAQQEQEAAAATVTGG